MFVKIEISFFTDQKQQEIHNEVDKILKVARYISKLNIEFKEEKE